jgi:hypothetical protein
MVVIDDERRERVAALIAELGELASELSGLSISAEKASAAGDVEAISEACELMLAAHVRYAERYRTLLVVRLREPRISTIPPGPQLSSL